MSCGGFARAALLLLALACSGPTDIVGVVDGVEPGSGELPSDTAGAAAEPDVAQTDDDAASESDVALLLAGQPVTAWPGEALEWPLSMPLGELFAAPSNDRDGRDRLMPGLWPSRRVAASGFARGAVRSTSDIGPSPRFATCAASATSSKVV